MRSRLVAHLVSESSYALTALVREKKSLERGALCLAEETWLCINIMKRLMIEYFYAG
jgi:hypothetical protein